MVVVNTVIACDKEVYAIENQVDPHIDAQPPSCDRQVASHKKSHKRCDCSEYDQKNTIDKKHSLYIVVGEGVSENTVEKRIVGFAILVHFCFYKFVCFFKGKYLYR